MSTSTTEWAEPWRALGRHRRRSAARRAVLGLLAPIVVLAGCASSATVTASGAVDLPSASGSTPPGTAPDEPGTTTSSAPRAPGSSTSTTRRRSSTTSTTGSGDDDEALIAAITEKGLLTPDDLADGPWTVRSEPDHELAPLWGDGGVLFTDEQCPDVVASNPTLADGIEMPHSSASYGADPAPDDSGFGRSVAQDVVLLPYEDTAEAVLDALSSEAFFACFNEMVTADVTGDLTFRTTTGKDFGDGDGATIEFEADSDGDGTPDYVAFHSFRVGRAFVSVIVGYQKSATVDTDPVAEEAADKVRAVLED